MRNRAEIEVELTLIRHGATVSNLEHRYLGKTEEPLAQEGRQTLLARKERHVYPCPRYLFTGPMQRCRQTAELLFPKREIQVIGEWTEMDFGVFEGKNYDELKKDAGYQTWIDSKGTLPFPEGESREEFTARTKKGFWRMITLLEKEETAVPGECGPENKKRKTEAAAVVHGGTIMALCSAFSGGEYFDYQVKNGEGCRCLFLCREENARLMEWEKV